MGLMFGIIALFFIPLVGWAEGVDVEFMGSKGEKYRTTTVGKQLKESGSEQLTVILIETPSFNDLRFLEQLGEINAYKKEVPKHHLMLIVACAYAVFDSGFHTSTETAKKLAPPQGGFRARILDGAGKVLDASETRLTKDVIKAHDARAFPN